MTTMPRGNVASMSVRHQFDLMCPLGIGHFLVKTSHSFNTVLNFARKAFVKEKRPFVKENVIFLQGISQQLVKSLYALANKL